MTAGRKVGAIDDPVWSEAVVVATGRTPRQRRRQIVAIALISLLGLCFAYAGAATVLSRINYGTAAFWKAPTRIEFCGRRYYNEGTVTGTPASLMGPYPAAREHWTEIARTFSLRPIYAGVVASHSRTGVCAMILYVPAGGDRWWSYPLSGGP